MMDPYKVKEHHTFTKNLLCMRNTGHVMGMVSASVTPNTYNQTHLFHQSKICSQRHCNSYESHPITYISRLKFMYMDSTALITFIHTR